MPTYSPQCLPMNKFGEFPAHTPDPKTLSTIMQVYALAMRPGAADFATNEPGH